MDDFKQAVQPYLDDGERNNQYDAIAAIIEAIIELKGDV